MSDSSGWAKNRGFDRLLTQETNLSDLLQYLSDQDSGPWENLVGFVPKEVCREVPGDGNADLVLVGSDGRRAVVKVKLGHVFSDAQRIKYEALVPKRELFLAGLSADAPLVAMSSEQSLSDSARKWSFLSLADLFGAWTGEGKSTHEVASLASETIRRWDTQVKAVFVRPDEPGVQAMAHLSQKFLVRLATRQIELRLRRVDRWTSASLTSGGGWPIVAVWANIRGEEEFKRCFMAEIRWSKSGSLAQFRFGVDFEPNSGETETPELRRAAYDLALSMIDLLDFKALKTYLKLSNPRISGILVERKVSRPKPLPGWEQVILDGLGKDTRRSVQPQFYGDGTLRFQAMVDIDLAFANGNDVSELLDATLQYLSEKQPR